MRTMGRTVEPKFLDGFKNMKAAYRQQLRVLTQKRNWILLSARKNVWLQSSYMEKKAFLSYFVFVCVIKFVVEVAYAVYRISGDWKQCLFQQPCSRLIATCWARNKGARWSNKCRKEKCRDEENALHPVDTLSFPGSTTSFWRELMMPGRTPKSE